MAFDHRIYYAKDDKMNKIIVKQLVIQTFGLLFLHIFVIDFCGECARCFAGSMLIYWGIFALSQKIQFLKTPQNIRTFFFNYGVFILFIILVSIFNMLLFLDIINIKPKL